MIPASRLAWLARSAGLVSPSIVLAPLDNPSEGVALEPDRALYPASMIKLPIALALAVRCASGDLDWDDEVRIGAENMTANDAPSPCVEGACLSLAELSFEMISASDNVATNVLIDVLGRETIGPACAPFGLRDTAVRRKLSGNTLIDDPAATGRNTHPSGDAALILRAIALGTAPAADRLHAALRAQIWNDKLSRGLLAGDRFVHKTGDTSEVSHDGGILRLADGRRFVLVVYTALPSFPENDARFAAFARALRPYFDRNEPS
jgi:beta-lactamase class A